MVLSSNVRAKRVRLVPVAMSAFALAAMMALPVKYATVAEAKTPGSTYCFHGTCHRVKTLEETRALVGVDQTLYASHYDDCKNDRYNPCGLTSSGERFHADRPDNTASPIYPDGTTLLVWNPETERALVVRVNNAGPYWGNRKLDLSRAAARKLGFEGKGVAKLKVRVIKAPDTKEARYSRNRTYPAVPGDIGEYDSLDEAQTGMAVALALQASAASPLAPVTASNVFSRDDEKNAEPLVAEAPELKVQRVAAVEQDEDYVRQASLGFTDLTPQSHWRGRPSLPRIASLVSIRRPGQRLLQSTWDGHDFVDDTADDQPEQQVALASAVEDALKRSAASDAVIERAPKTSPITTGTVEKASPKKVAAKTDNKADKKQKAQMAAKLDKPVELKEEAPQKVAVLSEPVKAEPATVEAKKIEAEKPEVSKTASADEDKSAKRSSKSTRRASNTKKRNNYGSRNQQRVANNQRYRGSDRYERVAQNSGGSWGNDYRPSRTAQQLQSANLRASPFSSM